MTSPAPLLRQCLHLALTEAPGLLMRCTDATATALDEAQSRSSVTAERQRLTAALVGLHEHRLRWAGAFPGQLKQQLEAGASPASRPAPLSASHVLTLVDDEALNGQVESARWLQAVLPLVEQELVLLDSLMSSLQGLDTVKAERNPLRPSVFLDAWQSLMEAADPQVTLRGDWMRHSAAPLGQELNALYARLNAQLQRAQVHEAGYRVRLTSGGGGSGQGRTGQAAGEAANGLGTGARAMDSLPSLSQLGRLAPPLEQGAFEAFMESGHSHFQQPLGSGYYREVEQALADMDAGQPPAPVDETALEQQRRQHIGLPAVDRPAREVGIGSQLSEESWGSFATPQERSREMLRLKQQARRADQAMGLELVRTLVDQVARDGQLLAPVREAVVALEPALLRLALGNPRFFNEDDHPARRLIESVAQRSFHYNDEFSPDFEHFIEPVQEAFNALNEAQTDEPLAFEFAQAGLQRAWDQQDQQTREAQEASLRAIRHVEERQALADQVAWDLSQRPDVHNAPAEILDFLYGTWSLVIAAASLADPQRDPASLALTDPGGYRKLVSRLLWSVNKQVTLKRPAELFDMVPGMLSTLHAGLELLGKTPEETQPFFDALMRLHQPVLALRRARTRSDAAHSAPSPLEPDPADLPLDAAPDNTGATAAQRPPRARHAAQPWLARRELDAAGFQDTLPSDHAELDAVEAPAWAGAAGEDGVVALAEHGAGDTGEVTPDEDWDSPAAAVLAALQQGRWVDLYSHQEWLRAQLVWASARGTLFMFVSRGGRSHSMTRRSCERLVARRLLRLVEAGPVVDKAIETVRRAQPRAEAVPA